MAKSARASTRKANNQRLKSKVFGPVEAARMERLSAKLLELAAQPKPPRSDSEMKIVDDEEEVKMDEDAPEGANEDVAMEIDTAKPAASKRSQRKRIEKRRKTSKIVFPKYKDRQMKNKKN
ncbi:hypothetical protein BJ170DRAFT_339538 [Xylariales sp. AK1849]|nr:hypothetical protein BJ170DRAFT_339538 [Xylariales sp. AK1849]